MLKSIFVFVSIFSVSAFASFQKISEIQTCSVKNTCLRDCGSEYMRVPLGFVCEHNDLVKVYDKDFDKPIETCLTEKDESGVDVQVCTITDYEKLETFTWKIVFNQEKKDAYMLKEAQKQEQLNIEKTGALNKLLTQRALNYIGGLYSSLPETEIDGLLVTYGEVYTALSQSRKSKATRLLNELEVTGRELELKTQLLKILEGS